ncbi:ester cyclase [Ruminococcaceae bacterium OttesenSCG-928-I18]|nr:ester cyclase [Ruminococcaceae bacterium OttesenSCG-928-I18]
MENKERVKFFFENVDSVDFSEYVADGCTARAGDALVPMGVNGMRQHFMAVRGTYPDLKMTVTRQYCDGEYVITEFLAEGTHDGEWLGMKPTGQKLSFTGVNINKVVNGKIVEHSGVMNTFETLFEAGVIKPA